MAGESPRGMIDKEIVVLSAFSRALRRESHVFTQYLNLLWQHVYNRLQWEAQEIKDLLSFVVEKVGRITKPGAGCQPAHRIFRFISLW